MTKQFLLLLLLLPISVFAQQAFYDTWKIIDQEDFLLREDIKELVTVYQEKTSFNSENQTQLEYLLNFIENPFREDFDYQNFSTESTILLKELIVENKSKKKEIHSQDYELILACDSLLPQEYEVFLKDDKIILDNELYACYEAGFDSKYPSDYEEIANRVPLPKSESVTEPAFSHHSGQSISSIPTPPVISFPTRVIDATSQFLVERVKEELLLSFFDRFLDHVDNSVELTSLLPNTYFLLENNDIFKVPSMGEVWVTAFEEDLNSVLDNLKKMVTTNPKYITVGESPNLQYFLMAGFIYQQIQKEKDSNLSQKLNYFYENFADSDLQSVKMLGVMNLLSSNLREKDSFSDWISISNYRNLFKKKENAALYFTALLFQQDRGLFNSIEIKTDNAIDNLGNQMKTNVKSFTQKTGKFLSAINQFKISNEAYKYAQDDDSLSLSAYSDAKFGYALAIFDLLDYGIELAYFKNPESLVTSDYHTIFRPLAITAIQTYDAIQRKDHGQMMLYSMQLLEPIVQVRIDHLEKKILPLKNNTSTNPTLELKNKAIQKELKILNGVVKNYVYYGGFMIDILSAESSGQIKDIIYKYAEPAGSYRVKRQSPFSVSLSSYPGLYGGLEITENNNASFVTGVTAPIGLSLNWGQKRFANSKKGHSLSLYFPVIDIGAAFSYRWKNSEGEGFPENIKWEQVLSPGIHGVWGIGNSPMALMFGTQYTPLLRNITNSSNELQSNAWRIGATISVDISIMHFYRSSRIH